MTAPPPALAVAVLVGLAAPLAAQSPDMDPAGEIRAREEALARAMHARDLPGLDALLAAGYILRGSPDLDRQTWIRNAVTHCWGDRSDIDGLRVQRHDDVAIASFELTFYVDPATCRPAVLRSLVTDVWVREGGQWRLHVRHAGPPPADASLASQYGAVPQAPPVWEVASELSLVATGGNTSTLTLGLDGGLTHRLNRRTTAASISFLTSEVDSVTRARSLTLEARHGFAVGERLTTFVEAGFARDQFAGIEGRTSLTAGLGYAARLPQSHTLTGEAGAGITIEDRQDATGRSFATATGALHYVWALRPEARLTQDAGISADLQSGRNWRATSETALHVTLTRVLSLKASHAVEYRNAPVAGFGRTDLRSAAALVIALQRYANEQ